MSSPFNDYPDIVLRSPLHRSRYLIILGSIDNVRRKSTKPTALLDQVALGAGRDARTVGKEPCANAFRLRSVENAAAPIRLDRLAAVWRVEPGFVPASRCHGRSADQRAGERLVKSEPLGVTRPCVVKRIGFAMLRRRGRCGHHRSGTQDTEQKLSRHNEGGSERRE